MRQAKSLPPKLKAFTAQAYDHDLAAIDRILSRYWGLRTKIFAVILRDLRRSLETDAESTIHRFLTEFNQGDKSKTSTLDLD